MWALGDKIASSIVAQTAGIPTLPWSGAGTTECSDLKCFYSAVVVWIVFTLIVLVFFFFRSDSGMVRS